MDDSQMRNSAGGPAFDRDLERELHEVFRSLNPYDDAPNMRPAFAGQLWAAMVEAGDRRESRVQNPEIPDVFRTRVAPSSSLRPGIPAAQPAPLYARFAPGLMVAALVVAIGLLGSFLVASRGFIQPEPTTSPDAYVAMVASPTLAHCDAPIRSTTELRALAPPPVATTQTPVIGISSPSIVRQSPGSAVDDGIMRQITATVSTLARCIEIGSLTLESKLLSDGYVHRALQPMAESGFSIEEMIASTRRPALGGPPEVRADSPEITVTDVRKLPDGRVGAVVADLPGYADPLAVIFVNGSVGWQIDEFGALDSSIGNKEPGFGSPVAISAPEVPLSANDMYFEPARLVIPAGQDFIVSMTNRGQSPHNFSIDSLEINVDVPPNEVRPVLISAATAPGIYEFYDAIPGHKANGMTGQLVIEQP